MKITGAKAVSTFLLDLMPPLSTAKKTGPPCHEISTMMREGWNSVKNGKLLNLIEKAGFEVFITNDICSPPQSFRQLPSGMAINNFPRIMIYPEQMGGVPCVRGLRISVATVIRLFACGLPEREILAEYPDLQQQDLRECLQFAAATLMEGMEGEISLPQPALNF